MTWTQIQLPDPLYQRLKEIAEQEDWSLSEVMGKAAERFVTRFPEEGCRLVSRCPVAPQQPNSPPKFEDIETE